MKRVVITGLGTVSPVGNDVDSTWDALLAGTSGIAPTTLIDASTFSSRIAGEVKNFDLSEDILPRRDRKKVDRFIEFALAASREAADDAGFTEPFDDDKAPRVGVMVGSGMGGLPAIENVHRTFMEKGAKRITPFFIPMVIINLASGHVSIMLNAKGPNSCAVTACATGTHSIGDAFKIIQRGQADVIFSGGTEAAIAELGIGGFAAMKALSTRNDEPEQASRPFDQDRDGFVMAEGSGVVVLEELEHALARGARIYGEVVGYGLTGDAYHITSPAPDGEGAARCMQMALDDAGIAPESIGYINAHGTSTHFNDLNETTAIHSVFGAHAPNLLVSSTKSMVGHMLGAAGGFEAVVCAKALQTGQLPPTINLDHPGEGCDLNYIPHRSISASLEYAMSNSFGFGGTNATLILRQYPS